jgi:hypothetical protein
MKTTLAPLSGIQRLRNGFELPPAVDDDLDFGRKMYDLKSVLLGNPGGYERELGESIQKRCPELRLRGIPIPLEVFTRSQSYSQRDLTADTVSGANLVQTFREETIQSALRPFSACAKAGAQFLVGLRDSVSIPRWESPSAATALLETSSVTPSAQTVSLLSLKPHRISNMTIISRQLMKQTSTMGTGIEDLIAQEMLASIGSSLDNYCLNGSGTAGQPTGLLSLGANPPGGRDLSLLAPEVAFAGPPNWATLCSFIGNVESCDVVADESSAWILSPGSREKWISTEQVTGFPRYLSENNACAGFPVFVTSNLSGSNRCVYGRWSSLVVAIWAASVLVDPITQSMTGNVRIFTDLWADCGPIYGPAFASSSDAANQ